MLSEAGAVQLKNLKGSVEFMSLDKFTSNMT